MPELNSAPSAVFAVPGACRSYGHSHDLDGALQVAEEFADIGRPGVRADVRPEIDHFLNGLRTFFIIAQFKQSVAECPVAQGVFGITPQCATGCCKRLLKAVLS